MAEARDLLRDLRSFEDLDEATRINHAMGLGEAERDALIFHLLFSLRSDVDSLRRENSLRRLLAHGATALLAAAVAVFGGPHIPGR